MVASRHPSPEEMDAYEKVLGDAISGDVTLFAREDYVEEAWRIIDPVLKADRSVYEYEPGTWGPGEVEKGLAPPGAGTIRRQWRSPVLEQAPMLPNQVGRHDMDLTQDPPNQGIVQDELLGTLSSGTLSFWALDQARSNREEPGPQSARDCSISITAARSEDLPEGIGNWNVCWPDQQILNRAFAIP
jgi:Glucose-6-phosphate dehydrogenase, C-terminal domain